MLGSFDSTAVAVEKIAGQQMASSAADAASLAEKVEAAAVAEGVSFDDVDTGGDSNIRQAAAVAEGVNFDASDTERDD